MEFLKDIKDSDHTWYRKFWMDFVTRTNFALTFGLGRETPDNLEYLREKLKRRLKRVCGIGFNKRK